MHRHLAIVIAMLLVVVATACGGGDSASPGPVTTGAEFGVPECDSYMQKYAACIAKMPEAGQAMARQAMDQTKTQWQQAASTPAGRSALAAACKAASDAAAVSMSAYGCW
jgi:hypothetical protein